MNQQHRSDFERGSGMDDEDYMTRRLRLQHENEAVIERWRRWRDAGNPPNELGADDTNEGDDDGGE